MNYVEKKQIKKIALLPACNDTSGGQENILLGFRILWFGPA